MCMSRSRYEYPYVHVCIVTCVYGLCVCVYVSDKFDMTGNTLNNFR